MDPPPSTSPSLHAQQQQQQQQQPLSLTSGATFSDMAATIPTPSTMNNIAVSSGDSATADAAPGADADAASRREISNHQSGDKPSRPIVLKSLPNYSHSLQSPHPPHYPTRNTCKIIKGEIHNVLTVMRSDPRYYYYSTRHDDDNNNNSDKSSWRFSRTNHHHHPSFRSRFEYEEQRSILSKNPPQQYPYTADSKHSYNGSSDSGGTSSSTIASHPILQGLRELHDLLSIIEAEQQFFYHYHPSLPTKKNNNNNNYPLPHPSPLDTNQNNSLVELHSTTFILPFANAVRSREVDAKTTAAALSALHKFIVYGFLGEHSFSCEEEDEEAFGMQHQKNQQQQHHHNHHHHHHRALHHNNNNNKMNATYPTSGDTTIRESISIVARCIRQCSFGGNNLLHHSFTSHNEQGRRKSSNDDENDDCGGDGGDGFVSSFLFNSRGKSDYRERNKDCSSISSSRSTVVVQRNTSAPGRIDKELPSFLTQSRRSTHPLPTNKRSTTTTTTTMTTTTILHNATSRTMDVPPISSNNIIKSYTSLSPSDEDVLLKLLSLSVQILRCPAGQSNNSNLLLPEDVVGIFDTCLSIAISAQEAKRSLLCSAAADALSHCVIAVFGMQGRHSPCFPHSKGIDDNHNVVVNSSYNDDDGEEEESDDDWGERDPAEDIVEREIVSHGVSPGKMCQVSSPDGMQGGEEDEVGAGAEGKKCNTPNVLESKEEPDNVEEEEPALVAIMHRLAILADPLLHEDGTCILALTLVNIALETMADVDALPVRYPRLLNILQNELCRNLLRLSTSADLNIVGLSLRVIFNLFNGMKDHLKVQLEVFLTSVHLRMLSFSVSPNSNDRIWSAPPEKRELALESLLEFCREPMLMTDLYMNYDCDINCTNLFEIICSTLARVAYPTNFLDPPDTRISNSERKSTSSSEMELKPRLNILNRLALEGVLAVIDGIARKCRASTQFFDMRTTPERNAHLYPFNHSSSPPESSNSSISLNGRSFLERLNQIDETDYDFCSVSTTSLASENHDKVALVRNISTISDDTTYSLTRSTSLALHERKLHKRRIAKAASKFNERSKDNEWIEVAERIGILPSPATPSAIASFLYSTPILDKARVGLYLSMGPKEQYPFHSNVLACFVDLFDFSGMSFSDALRTFLSRFRLPGEAQCIDRLMEAFALRLYENQKMASETYSDINQSVEKAMLDPPHGRDTDGEDCIGIRDPPTADDEDKKKLFPFKSSDAVYIMSFSTIMLNTDLHNPNMKDEKRMTLDQFIRNNRGINEGTDLPLEFLTNLYNEIKSNQIQVERDFLHDGIGDAHSFEMVLAKGSEVATPFFTSNVGYHKFHAGIHERDMYISISTTAHSAIEYVFVESWDDGLVKKALDGLRNSAYISTYFGLNKQFNQILDSLLGFGLDYIESVAPMKVNTTPSVRDSVTRSEIRKPQYVCQNKENTIFELDIELASRNIPPLPEYFLRTLSNESNRNTHLEIGDLAGSAAHRGLLSLHCALSLSRQYLSIVDEAWLALLEVIFALRDLASLPPGLSDLDDFADSRGNPLPSSLFAIKCNDKVKEYRQLLMPVINSSNKVGFLASIFGHSRSTNRDEGQVENPFSAIFLMITQATQLDKIIMKTNDVTMAKRMLAAMLCSMFPTSENYDEMASNPLFEHNSVFVLELAARFLILNRAHASDLYSLFYAKFMTLLSPQSEDPKHPSEGLIIWVQFPFLLERIVVTILRACIHLFDAPIVGLRDQLLRSLNLITNLPSSYVGAISDRIGCGAAIILRACFYLFDEKAEAWSTIKCLLDLAAQESSGRGFVFDGIASVIDSIDYAIPSNGTIGGDLSDENGSNVQLSQYGVEVMASLLLKFMNGSYNDDLSFKVPSMFYIKKLYTYSQHFDRAKIDNFSVNNDALLEANEFETMVTAIYNDVCLSNDELAAKKGFESLQGMVVSTPLDSLPVPRWLKFLRMVTDIPPSIDSSEARAHHLSLISRLFLTLVPNLSNQTENWPALEESTIGLASIVRSNLQSGRAKPLFETTVHIVTNMVNVISMSVSGVKDAEEGNNFCAWVRETLLNELERMGASGGAAS